MCGRALLLLVAGLGLIQPGTDGDRIKRLADLGKVWGTIKLFHPYLVSRDVAWDQALVKAIPRVSAAQNEVELRKALDEMLSTLGDPRTRIQDGEPPSPLELPAAPPMATTGGALVLTVRAFPSGSAWAAEKPRIVAAIHAATLIVVDLRVSPDDGSSWTAWHGTRSPQASS